MKVDLSTSSNDPSAGGRDDLLREISRLEERCRRAEDALRTLEEKNRLLGDSAPFGILVTDTEGRVFGANGKMATMLAWPAEQDITRLNIIEHPPMVSSGVADAFRRCLESGVCLTSDHACLNHGHDCSHLRYYISPVIDKSGRSSGLIAFVEDVTELKRAEEALRASEQHFRMQAMEDNLTGLYNRRYLYHSLAELIEQAKASGSVISLIFMDLDHFKDVVDTHGHLNGSRAIKEVAETIRETLVKPAYAVAYAGDEFVVVLPGLDPIQATEQARKIQDRMNERVFLRDESQGVRIRSSFGIAAFPHHAEDVTELLAAADQALFGAKNSGKDAMRVFG